MAINLGRTKPKKAKLGYETMRDLSDAMIENKSIKNYSFFLNNVDDFLSKFAFSFLEKNCVVNEIDFSYNSIGTQGVGFLAKHVLANEKSALKKVYLIGCSIT